MAEVIRKINDVTIGKSAASFTKDLKDTFSNVEGKSVVVDGLFGRQTCEIFFDILKRDGARLYIKKYGSDDKYYLILPSSVFYKLCSDDVSEIEGYNLYNNDFVLLDSSTGKISMFRNPSSSLAVGDRLKLTDRERISIYDPMVLSYGDGVADRRDKELIDTGIMDQFDMSYFNTKTPFALYAMNDNSSDLE